MVAVVPSASFASASLMTSFSRIGDILRIAALDTKVLRGCASLSGDTNSIPFANVFFLSSLSGCVSLEL